MRAALLCAILLAPLVVAAFPEPLAGPLPPLKPPVGPPAQYCRVWATQEQNVVTLHVELVESQHGEIVVDGETRRAMVAGWSQPAPLKLDDKVAVFRRDGRRADSTEVWRKFKQPQLALCFPRIYPDDAQTPDPQYLALQRDDALVLTFELTDVVPPPPP